MPAFHYRITVTISSLMRDALPGDYDQPFVHPVLLPYFNHYLCPWVTQHFSQRSLFLSSFFLMVLQ